MHRTATIKRLCWIAVERSPNSTSSLIPPTLFSDAEICKVVDSAWSYEQDGKNWVGKEQRVYTTKSEIHALSSRKRGGDALLLLSILRLAHWNRPIFVIAPKAMEQANVIPDWDCRRYRAARDELIECGLITLVHKGGRGIGDVSRYAFAKPVDLMGAQSVPFVAPFDLPPFIPQ